MKQLLRRVVKLYATYSIRHMHEHMNIYIFIYALNISNSLRGQEDIEGGRKLPFIYKK